MLRGWWEETSITEEFKISHPRTQQDEDKGQGPKPESMGIDTNVQKKKKIEEGSSVSVWSGKQKSL